MAEFSRVLWDNPKTESSKQFFRVVQNKMHWAAHGHTAAEVIYSLANAEKTNMGLTSWSGKKPRQADAEIAKNHLNEEVEDVLKWKFMVHSSPFMSRSEMCPYSPVHNQRMADSAIPLNFNLAAGVAKTNPSALNGKYTIDTEGNVCVSCVQENVQSIN
ncbi:MAG TPA: RhuM family protein [Chlamydiales bacterium]|nr:RhuM family protein [Chlamydiales bacterium]